jgi:hypothetical protein
MTDANFRIVEELVRKINERLVSTEVEWMDESPADGANRVYILQNKETSEELIVTRNLIKFKNELKKFL